jgi:hypothetical protein
MPSITLRKVKGRARFLLQNIIPLLLILLLSTGPAFADDSLELKYRFRPGLLSADGDWTLALNYDVKVSKIMWYLPRKNAFRKQLMAHVATQGTLAADSDLNTEPLLADAGFTIAINFYRPPIISLGAQPGEYKTEEKGFNWGRLSFSLLAGYESDQTLDNQNLTVGGEIGYVLTENQGIKALIPSIFVGYDFVFDEHSDLEQDLGDNDDYRRFRMFASWKIPVGQWLPEALDALNAHFDLRYYKSDGLPRSYQVADQDEAVYKAGSLSYSFGQQPLLGVVNEVYVRIADGRIPPVTEDNTTLMVGMTVWER